MPPSLKATAPPYIAEVKNSREITLLGTADLGFWTRKLRFENLVPIEKDGHAELMVSAVASRWLGVPFSEISVSVMARPLDWSGTLPSLYLLTAYNTSRAFTFIEQRYFQTPYSWGSIEVQLGETSSAFRLMQRSSELVAATRKSSTATPSKVDEVWEGAIYLPPRITKSRVPGNLFYARLGGLTEIAPFVPGEDRIDFKLPLGDPAFQWVVESKYAGREWHIRHSATHARSKTYQRS